MDIPKRRPHPASGESKADEKPAGTPKKYAAFSIKDSKAIEAAFQKLVDIEDQDDVSAVDDQMGDISQQRINISLDERNAASSVKVPVNVSDLWSMSSLKHVLMR